MTSFEGHPDALESSVHLKSSHLLIDLIFVRKDLKMEKSADL